MRQTLLDTSNTLCGLLGYAETLAGPFESASWPQKTGTLCFHVEWNPDFAITRHLRAMEFVMAWLRSRFHPMYYWTHVHKRYVHVYKLLGFAVFAQNGDWFAMELDRRPFLDASVPLQNGVRQYPGDPPFQRMLLDSAENSGYHVSILTMSVHTGTHIDAPAHVGLWGGAETIDLDLLHGTVQLIDWQQPDFDAIQSSRILLARTQRGLTAREARILVEAGITLIGIDRLSVGVEDEEREVHQSLLQNHIILIENADLHRFCAGWYEMRCLPLSMPGSDGTPVRLLLREECLCGNSFAF